ncbi:threonylcarbamoyl-AMP synthase [Patescibacteria group bacterium]|nr:threonylcarbamoyl-AMP synthase [Patescibacteria group bacterium]
MKVIRKNNIKEAVTILKNKGVIVYPTDTAYGLGGVFDSKKVINQILKIKNRKDKKFTIIASSQHQVEKFFKLNSIEKKLAKKYWPGSLSIVVSKNFAVRVPKNIVAQTLARRVGKPLIATSANVTGQKPAYDVKVVKKQFLNKKNQPELILESGRLKKIKPSTVVKVKDSNVIIVRKGSVNL